MNAFAAHSLILKDVPREGEKSAFSFKDKFNLLFYPVPFTSVKPFDLKACSFFCLRQPPGMIGLYPLLPLGEQETLFALCIDQFWPPSISTCIYFSTN